MGMCRTCQYRDVNRRYCFNANVPRFNQIEQIKTKGLIGLCELYVENTEPLIGEKANKATEQGNG